MYFTLSNVSSIHTKYALHDQTIPWRHSAARLYKVLVIAKQEREESHLRRPT